MKRNRALVEGKRSELENRAAIPNLESHAQRGTKSKMTKATTLPHDEEQSVELHYIPNFFPVAESDSHLVALLKLPWHQHIYRMYGKPVPAPRHYVWMGGDGYRSPKTVGDVYVHPWTLEVLLIKTRVEAITGVAFNSCNVNLYRNKDST